MKEFDCVDLKNRIQDQIREENRGINETERWARLEETLSRSDHPVARKWRELAEAHTAYQRRP